MNNYNIITLASLILILSEGCKSSKDYDATGIFEATTVTISSETAGKIVEIRVKEGENIRKDELIAVIDTSLLVLQQRQFSSQRASAENKSPDISAQVAALKSQIQHQEKECERFSHLLADGATTQKTYDDATAYLTTLRGQLAALLSNLDNSKSSISQSAEALFYQEQQIREQINRSKINSPLTGTILEKYAENGEFTTPGRPICQIADLEDIYLRAYFTVSQLSELKLGQSVTVIADFGKDNIYEYPGKIIWIAQESEFTPKSIQTPDSRANLVYAVKIAVKNDGRLKLGQYGEVRL